MASVATAVSERRHERRWHGGGPQFAADAILRPGQAVVLVNLSRRGALVDSGAPLRPGAQTELALCGAGTRIRVRGRITRCRVSRLDPLRYHGGIVFDECVDVGE